jgi:hypothetical protein
LVRWAREAPVTAGPGNHRSTVGHNRLRAADADREQVIDQVKAAFLRG